MVTPDSTRLQPLMDALGAALQTAASANPAEAETLLAFANDLEALPQGLPFNPRPSSPVRGLRFLAEAAHLAQRAFPGPLTHGAREAAGWARWTEFYREDPWSAPFLDRFAMGEIVGPTGSWLCNDVIVGLFVFGPELDYPPHAHPAEEIYIPLNGAPQFQVGVDASHRARLPGEVILHRPDVSHAIRTHAEPVFGLWAWRGAIAEPSWYRTSMGDDAASKRYPPLCKPPTP
ncbi:MAG: dimethylsulfonioproprionate lyase family protein [Candidatus Competibacterales bacterium]